MSDPQDSRELAQQRFGALAQNYVSSHVHSGGHSLDRLIELVQPAPGKLALDVATGGGHVALALAKRGAKTIASDVTVSMLRAARENLSGQGIQAAYMRIDGHHLPFAAGSLDIVTARHAPHHFKDVAGYVRECARVARVGGIVGVVDQIAPEGREAAEYVNSFERLRDPSHGWQFSLAQWVGFFEDAGLRVINSEISSLRFDLAWWTKMQRNDADTVLRLRVMLRQAPQAVVDFLAPVVPDEGPDEAVTFGHHYGIVVGVKE